MTTSAMPVARNKVHQDYSETPRCAPDTLRCADPVAISPAFGNKLTFVTHDLPAIIFETADLHAWRLSVPGRALTLEVPPSSGFAAFAHALSLTLPGD